MQIETAERDQACPGGAIAVQIPPTPKSALNQVLNQGSSDQVARRTQKSSRDTLVRAESGLIEIPESGLIQSGYRVHTEIINRHPDEGSIRPDCEPDQG